MQKTEGEGASADVNGSASEKNGLSTDKPKKSSNGVLENNLEKTFLKKVIGNKEIINLSEYEKIKRKELQDARALKYPNDITNTYATILFIQCKR